MHGAGSNGVTLIVLLAYDDKSQFLGHFSTNFRNSCFSVKINVSAIVIMKASLENHNHFYLKLRKETFAVCRNAPVSFPASSRLLAGHSGLFLAPVREHTEKLSPVLSDQSGQALTARARQPVQCSGYHRVHRHCLHTREDNNV